MSDTPTEVNTFTGIADRLLSIKDILGATSMSKAYLYRLMREGRFPAPTVRLGPRFTRWHQSVVNDWIAERGSTAARKDVAEAA